MRVETITEIVPAHEIVITRYIASDNTAFRTEAQCKEYEEWLSYSDNPVAANKISGVSMYDEYDTTAYLYYLRNKADYDFLTQKYLKVSIRHTDSDFDEYGAGWYIYHEDRGDSNDSYIWNYNNYIKNLQDEFNRWKEIIDLEIKAKEKKEGFHGIMG